MNKIYLRFNLAKYTHLVQIPEQTKCYNIKDKLHIDKTLEDYYIGCDIYDEYTNNTNELYLITKKSELCGVLIYDLWSFNDIIQNINLIKKYTFKLKKIYSNKKDNEFSIVEKQEVLSILRFILNLLMSISTEEILNIKFECFMYNSEFIASKNLIVKILGAIDACETKMYMLKKLLE